MHTFINIRHDILLQCHVNYMEMKRVYHILEIDILRNSSQKYFQDHCTVRTSLPGHGTTRATGLGVQKDTQTPCWLRPCHICLQITLISVAFFFFENNWEINRKLEKIYFKESCELDLGASAVC